MVLTTVPSVKRRSNEMKVIGITGSIATGKSTVTNYLISLGYPVIDADRISFMLLEKQGDGYDLIIEHFGCEYLNEDETINRPKLSKKIFTDTHARQLINTLLHPLIYNQIVQKISEHQDDRLVFIDVPLLYEAGFDTLCDAVICVYAPASLQLERMMIDRHLTQSEATLRIESQMSIETKKEKADFVLNNQKTKDDLYQQIDLLLLDFERSYV